MAVPSLCPVTNLTTYSTPPALTVTFGIGEDVELANLGLLIRFNTQLISLVAWQLI